MSDLLVVHRGEYLFQFLVCVRDRFLLFDDRHLIPTERELDADLLTENTKSEHAIGYRVRVKTLRYHLVLEVLQNLCRDGLVQEADTMRKLFRKLVQVVPVPANGFLRLVLLRCEELLNRGLDGDAVLVSKRVEFENGQTFRLRKQGVAEGFSGFDGVFNGFAVGDDLEWLGPILCGVAEVEGTFEVFGPSATACIVAEEEGFEPPRPSRA